MKSGTFILKFLCAVFCLQLLFSLYLFLRLYVSSDVKRPDIENENSVNDYNEVKDEGFVINLDMKKNDFSINGIGREVLRVQNEGLSIEFNGALKENETKLIRSNQSKHDYNTSDQSSAILQKQKLQSLQVAQSNSVIKNNVFISNLGHELSLLNTTLERAAAETNKKPVHVTVWATAAIGSYLWEYLFGGSKGVFADNPTVYSGSLHVGGFNFHYKEGPGLNVHNLEALNIEDIGHLVLVLNGRTEKKIAKSKKWLEVISGVDSPPKVVVVLLGNEHCNNEWLRHFVVSKGVVHGVFVTYDVTAPIVEGATFQWPLGVATYRGFNRISPSERRIGHPRPHLCNLQATNYPSSSRSHLFTTLRSHARLRDRCVLRKRSRWLPKESPKSSEEYRSLLLQSDLTLCPSGINAETYRVYEAMEAGSVPVLAEEISEGLCDRQTWRLLRASKAPVIWLSSWEKVVDFLEREESLSESEKAKRRRRLHRWYERFKKANKFRLIHFIEGLI